MASVAAVGREAKYSASNGRKGRGLALGLGLAALAGGLLAPAFEAERVLVLQPYNTDPTSDARYHYELPAPTFPFAFRKDAIEGGLEPRLILKEDGSPLGPRLGIEYRATAAVEREIGLEGRGRHAYERGGLHFSASDNSDPRKNGRFYHLAYTIAVAPSARLLLVLAGPMLIVTALARMMAGNRRKAPATPNAMGSPEAPHG